MKIKFIVVGKTEEQYLLDGIDKFEKRLQHYATLENSVIPALKNVEKLSIEQRKHKEGELILNHITSSDVLILLDEQGKQFTSVEFSEFLQKRMNSGIKNLVFAVGGAYGFSDEIYKRANSKISFSKMTFSHQMIRLFFAEQLYRAFTILKQEPYHH